MNRREFLNSEADRFIRFYYSGGNTQDAVVTRTYTCECGFITHGAGQIFDHAQACKGE